MGDHWSLVHSQRARNAMLMFSLLVDGTVCWTNSWVACDLRHHDTHVKSPKCSCVMMGFHAYSSSSPFTIILEFYMRPVLAFRYCRCLHLCVCVCPSVHLSVNHEFIWVMARDLFKLGSPNLNQMCKTHWLRSLLFRGANLTILADNSSSVQAGITKFGPEVQNNMVKTSFDLGCNP